jgi:hypothetical protein
MSARKAKRPLAPGERLAESIREACSNGWPVFTEAQYDAAQKLLDDRHFGFELLLWRPIGHGDAIVMIEGPARALVRNGFVTKSMLPVSPSFRSRPSGTFRRARAQSGSMECGVLAVKG